MGRPNEHLTEGVEITVVMLCGIELKELYGKEGSQLGVDSLCYFENMKRVDIPNRRCNHQYFLCSVYIHRITLAILFYFDLP